MKLKEDITQLKDKLELTEKNLSKTQSNYKALNKMAKEYISAINDFKNILKNSKDFFIMCLNNFE